MSHSYLLHLLCNPFPPIYAFWCICSRRHWAISSSATMFSTFFSYYTYNYRDFPYVWVFIFKVFCCNDCYEFMLQVNEFMLQVNGLYFVGIMINDPNFYIQSNLVNPDTFVTREKSLDCESSFCIKNNKPS